MYFAYIFHVVFVISVLINLLQILYNLISYAYTYDVHTD